MQEFLKFRNSIKDKNMTTTFKKDGDAKVFYLSKFDNLVQKYISNKTAADDLKKEYGLIMNDINMIKSMKNQTNNRLKIIDYANRFESAIKPFSTSDQVDSQINDNNKDKHEDHEDKNEDNEDKNEDKIDTTNMPSLETEEEAAVNRLKSKANNEYIKLTSFITKNMQGIDPNVVNKHFKTKTPQTILNIIAVLDTNYNPSEVFNTTYRNLKLLKEESKNMSEHDVMYHHINEILYIFEKIIACGAKYLQKGMGLLKNDIKILTPQQMLTSLPISLAQLQAGNNSLKLKNEIRQLLYSLYRSKKISKRIYKNLIKVI